MANRYFIKLSFKGTRYHGWQVQENAATVQDILNRDLSLLLGEDIGVTGCGRTDAGVHAETFFAHFNTLHKNLGGDKDFLFRINRKLPKDIAIHAILPVQPDAHARYHAVSRTYRYQILRNKDVFQRPYAHYIYGQLDTDAMIRAAGILKEYNDFTSFSKVDTEVKNHRCVILDSRWEIGKERMDYRITADRFLRNMVRAIVGTLLDVGFRKKSAEDIRLIIESRDRSQAGTSAPARGLFLAEVRYPEEIFL